MAFVAKRELLLYDQFDAPSQPAAGTQAAQAAPRSWHPGAMDTEETDDDFCDSKPQEISTSDFIIMQSSNSFIYKAVKINT